MTLWETVWSQVRAEMPEQPSRPRSWGGFFGALIAGLVIIVIWFPIRLHREVTIHLGSNSSAAPGKSTSGSSRKYRTTR